jgi:5-methylcytosine-specific restriction endonuclease McrA
MQGHPELRKVEKESDRWLQQRRAAIERDDHTCVECGKEVGPKAKPGVANAVVHHVLPLGFGGTHQLSNLKTMCEQCHPHNSEVEIPEEIVNELREVVCDEG